MPPHRTPAAAERSAPPASASVVLGNLDVMAAPDLDAARRAADEIIDAGAGRVLLFGSVARGDATEHSDIDLVAIYDNLDYTQRTRRRCALESRAGDAAGCRVDVMVTDAPEWAVRTARVPCSVEAGIAADAVELADAGAHDRIEWDKEIGMPADPAAELEARFTDMSEAIAALTDHLHPMRAETDAAADGDRAEQAALEGVRFARAMGEIAMIAESAAKATHLVTVGTPPPHDHRVSVLLREQPSPVRDAFAAAAGPAVDLDELHVWRHGATYSADRPEARFDEDALRSRSDAALSIAAAAAEHCRSGGLSEATLARYRRRSQRANQALAAPLRH